MKTREISKILKSRIPVEEKREILEKAINKKSKAKKAAGIATVALIATGVTKIVADKKNRKKQNSGKIIMMISKTFRLIRKLTMRTTEKTTRKHRTKKKSFRR